MTDNDANIRRARPRDTELTGLVLNAQAKIETGVDIQLHARLYLNWKPERSLI